MTRRALVFTAFDRPGYLTAALETWKNVQGLHDWRVVARIEPGEYTDEIHRLFTKFWEETKHPNFHIMVNPERLGVLHHPWAAFNDLFDMGYEFVVRTEDDLRVSEDILSYFAWADDRFVNDVQVASIHGYTTEMGRADQVVIEPRFNPLVWGTWNTTWADVFKSTWDHDYSTHNGIPGVETGWDWNINTRIYPQRGLSGVYPRASRVDNIGIHGTHSTPENYSTSESFRVRHSGAGRYDIV